MSPRVLALALIPLLGAALPTARVPSVPVQARVVPLVAPAAPPNGTYVYALSRNGTDQGKTTVVLFRRDAEHVFETDEAGTVGAASAHVLAAFRYVDLEADAYAATYQAPFLRTSALGRVLRFRAKAGFREQTSVRYHFDDTAARVTIDGVPGETRFAAAPGRWIFDAPFMTSVALLPAFAHRFGAAPFAPVGLAFDAAETPVRALLERTAPRFPRTPKNDLVLDLHGVAQVWFDPATFMVHEAHFDALNLDARLLSYTKAAEPAPFDPAPAMATAASDPLENVTVHNEDGTALAGVVDIPATAKKEPAAIIFVPAGPGGDRDQGGDGPNPMYPDLARTFAQRGYETLRYDMRGIGKSSGSSADETWTQALGDAEAAAEFMESDENIDPKDIYFLGYGNGADLALAASAALADPVGGEIALAPTVLGYRECATRIAPASTTSASSRWSKSAAAHDPVALAARSRVPLFVLHPGVAVCGEKPAEVTDYDEKLRLGNPRVTAVVANDLSQRFAGRYDADAPANTEEFFPYRFDPSTAGAIGDWLDGAKSAGGGSQLPSATGPRIAPPPPPAPGRNDNEGGMPNPHLQTPLPRPSVEPGIEVSPMPSPT